MTTAMAKMVQPVIGGFSGSQHGHAMPYRWPARGPGYGRWLMFTWMAQPAPRLA
jgi:hypothetical protein